MPSWKKVIISGSAAELSSLFAPSITGSLQGTASFATTASTLTANTNAFIQGGNSFGTTALLGTNDNQNLSIETSGSVRMIISNGGNVGIGTTTPTAKLHVSGNAGAVNWVGTDHIYQQFYPSGLSAGRFGYIGYGFSGSTQLNITNEVAGGNLTLGTAGNANRLFISASGNVGIGTSTPLASLHTTGSAIISGSMVIGSSSLGPFENTLTLGARDTVAEGGQLGFNAPGGTYTSASFIDLYQNRLRILKGTNATSTGEVARWEMHTAQMGLPAYTSPTSFVGTAAGYLAFDSSGNILTVGGVAATPGGSTTQLQYNNAGVLAGTSAITFDGTTLRATGSFTGSLVGALTGTASFATTASRAITSSFALTASFVTGSNVFGPFGANSVISASFAVSASRALTSSFALTATSASYATTSSFSLAATANQLLVINKSGATIAKGVVVHLTGSTNSSDTPYITTASYESDNLSANSLGITAESIAFNSTGFVTTEGVLTGLDVTGFIAGQLVYLGANGAIIGAAPQAPLHSVRLGQVVRDSPSVNGSIYVRIDNGYEIGELHDIIDSTTTSTYGDLLVKSGSVWINSKQLTGPYGVTGSFSVKTPGASGIVLDTDINSDTLSSRLFFKISGSGEDISLRNSNGSLIIGHSATAGNASGTSAMIISGSGVAIGNNYTISSGRGAALQVSGSINIEDGFAYKQDGENVIYIQRNTGLTAGAFNNTIAGQGAAEGTAYFDQMTAVGYTALYQSSGSDQTAVGYVAGAFNTGSSQTLIGWGAGYQGKASNQTAVGEQAGWQNTGSNQTAIGIRAGQYNSGSNQTVIGVDAGVRNTATQQTAVGIQAGIDNIGVAQTAIGQQAGQNNSGSTQTAVGYAAGFQNSGSTQVAIGAQAGRDNIGNRQTATGYEAGRLNVGSNQSAFGYDAGYANSGSNQSVFGYEAGYLNTGSNQTAVGLQAGYQNSGSNQVAMGNSAGEGNRGNNQTAIGSQAGYSNTGSNQTAIGASAGYQNSGSDNTNIGYQAGTYTTGVLINSQSAQSVFLGSQTTAGGGNRTNQIVIGFNASGIGSNSVVLGNSSIATTALRGDVGIGTTTPTYTLQIHAAPTASIRLQETGSGGNKRLDLTIDPSGVARMSANQSAQQIAFDTTGGERLRITSTGNVGINKTTPNATLDVSGSTIISGSLTVTGGITGSITASGVFGPYGSNSVITSSFAVTASYVATASYATIKTSGTTIYSADPATTNFNTSDGILLGPEAGFNTNSTDLICIGRLAGYSTANGNGSIFIGAQSKAITSGVGSIHLGYNVNTYTSDYSNIIGYNSGYLQTTSYSTLIGYNVAGTGPTTTIGNNNIIIGTNITLPAATANGINIGGVLFGSNSSGVTVGAPVSSSAPNGRIGIGVVSPRATLDVSGSFHVEGTYKAPSGNTIDSNALIQAGLLYLSNNF